MTSARRLLALPIALVLAGGALAGCATPVASAPSASPSAGGGSTEAEVDAAWLDDGRIIGLVTMGSSTCVPAADEATLQADGSLAVTLVEPDAETVCTADMAPRVTLVEVPEGVDPSEDLAITVSGDGYSASTELAGVEGLAGGGMTDYLPSAGWTAADGAVHPPHVGLVLVPAGHRGGRGIRARRGHRHLRGAGSRPGLHDGHGPSRDRRLRRRPGGRQRRLARARREPGVRQRAHPDLRRELTAAQRVGGRVASRTRGGTGAAHRNARWATRSRGSSRIRRSPDRRSPAARP